MSFEGYYQRLCRKGHFSAKALYDKTRWDSACYVCGENIVWWNLVDQTNSDAYEVPLEMVTEAEFWECEHCNSRRLTAHPTYRIPDAKSRPGTTNQTIPGPEGGYPPDDEA
jgi:hypothetical protein